VAVSSPSLECGNFDFFFEVDQRKVPLPGILFSFKPSTFHVLLFSPLVSQHNVKPVFRSFFPCNRFSQSLLFISPKARPLAAVPQRPCSPCHNSALFPNGYHLLSLPIGFLSSDSLSRSLGFSTSSPLPRFFCDNHALPFFEPKTLCRYSSQFLPSQTMWWLCFLSPFPLYAFFFLCPIGSFSYCR